jgi:hypothetical protein
MFKACEHMFRQREHMFSALEHKISLVAKEKIPRGKIFSAPVFGILTKTSCALGLETKTKKTLFKSLSTLCFVFCYRYKSGRK